MTECERIIKKGVVTEDFLKEETICDFLVTSDRKKLFAVLLDMLLEFDKVCKKYGLTYFLDGGSMLGAVRHHGFIPWDDDIDVCMPRRDYDKFVTLKEEFNNPYFLQTPYTDPEYFYCPARIRNTNTTAMVETFAYQKFNHGIWLSIFPLDNWKPDTEKEVEKINELIKENSTYMRMTNPHLDDRSKERVRNYSGRNPLETYEEIQKIAQQFNAQPTGFVSAAVSCVLPYSKKIWKEEDFKSAVYVDFEGHKIPIPIGYDHILTTVYGDYMKFPPIEERGLHHSGTIFDADKPFTYYVSNLEK